MNYSETPWGTGNMGMTCEEVCEMLYLYICDELMESEVKSISSHLSTCPACRKAMSETVQLTGVLSTTLPRVPMQYYSRNN